MPIIMLAITDWIITFIVIGSILLLYFTISYFIYRQTLVDYNKPPVNLVNHEEDFYKDSYSWFQEIPKEDVFIKSYENMKLQGYYIPSFHK